MVNTESIAGRGRLRAVTAMVVGYVAIALGTVVALGVLSVLAPAQASVEAWVHAVIVAVFAVVLPLRLRAFKAGRRRALRAVGLISAALFLVNVIEAMIPHLFPGWMRFEMVVIAVLMGAVILLVVWEAVAGGVARPRT